MGMCQKYLTNPFRGWHGDWNSATSIEINLREIPECRPSGLCLAFKCPPTASAVGYVVSSLAGLILRNTPGRPDPSRFWKGRGLEFSCPKSNGLALIDPLRSG